MASNGTRGALFERQCRDALAALGYVVMRSTASKTPMDLAAFLLEPPRQSPWFAAAMPPCMIVQAKTNGRLDHDEWNVLYRLAEVSGTCAVLARREKVGRRYVCAFYELTGPKTPHMRKPPMVRILQEVPVDGA